MIPAGVLIKKGEILKENLSLVADQRCYTGCKIGGIVNGDITIIKNNGCGKWFPSNVHVFVEEGGIVNGNVFADHVIVSGLVRGNVVAQHVTILPQGRVEGKIESRYKVENRYVPPPFLRECDDPTVIALKKLEEKVFN
jgi:cytoskeletal protein CcmA (bactofilin family)